MAIKNVRKRRLNKDGVYDVIHYETNAKQVVMADGTTVEATLQQTTKNVPISKGAGENTIVIGDGHATGDHAIAGGTDDFNLIKNLTNNQVSEDAIEPATAEGDMSIAFGPSSKAITAGSVAIGTVSVAGCKGFYWHKIDFDNRKVFLSTEQKPYYTDNNGEQNTGRSWDSTIDGKLLSQWQEGDRINIAEITIHQSLKATIENVDGDNGVITLSEIPFTNTYIDANEINNYFASYGTTNLDFQDCSVCNPSKPEAGAIEYGVGSYVNGLNCKASGLYSYAVGRDNIAAANSAFVEGRRNVAGYSAHAEGRNTEALGDYSHTEGNGTKSVGNNSHAEGYKTTASGENSHAEGHDTAASGLRSHAEGHNTKASGIHSHAEGGATIASNQQSHAEGYKTTASGMSAHAEGSTTTASAFVAHAEGYLTVASGERSHAEGYGAIASGSIAHSEGYYTKAAGKHQHVQGKYNVEDTAGTYAHIVGNGTSDTARSNAHTIDWKGNAWFAGSIKKGAEETEITAPKYLHVTIPMTHESEFGWAASIGTMYTRVPVPDLRLSDNPKVYIDIGNECDWNDDVYLSDGIDIPYLCNLYSYIKMVIAVDGELVVFISNETYSSMVSGGKTGNLAIILEVER